MCCGCYAHAADRYTVAAIFCLTPQGLLSSDAELVQMLLVLTTNISFVVGGCVSWLWVVLKNYL